MWSSDLAGSSRLGYQVGKVRLIVKMERLPRLPPKHYSK